jgi:hypothetical protein
MLRILIVAVIAVMCLPGCVIGQDEIPLGDLARSLRKSRPALDDQNVIDNDNFAEVMDKAESARLNGEPIFAIDPVGAFHMVSPDGSCSLSFDAKLVSSHADAYVSSDLPQDELPKLDGPATVVDNTLQVVLHNGSAWDLKEVVIGVTVLEASPAASLQNANLMQPAVSGPVRKMPDSTVLYHLKGSAGPDSTSVFSASVDPDFAATRDWHWAIVGARGIPPAGPGDSVPQATVTPSPQPLATPAVQALPEGASAPTAPVQEP